MDSYKDFASTLTAPVRAAEAAPNGATTVFGHVPRALYVGGGGDLQIEMADGGIVTLPGVPGGSLLPLRAVRVLNGGTTATGVVALW